MPRIAPTRIWQAARCAGPDAGLLFPVCRDLVSTRAELRWIREHVVSTGSGAGLYTGRRVRALCRRRGRGEPLQYVLGTQPFGLLDLLCRRGVLIPRPEPEAYAMHLAALLRREHRHKHPHAPITILDLCTGSGCIALLLYARLVNGISASSVRVLGVDVAPEAVALARANVRRNRALLAPPDSPGLEFLQADVFDDAWLSHVPRPLDLLVANPPYVSPVGFSYETARSVRIFEPMRAQVPEADAGHEPGSVLCPHDRFYDRLLALAVQLDARRMLCEVGSIAQAQRVTVAVLATAPGATAPIVEIWRDAPDAVPTPDDVPRSVRIAGQDVVIRGSGRVRSVYVQR